jgi:hypothetical protein
MWACLPAGPLERQFLEGIQGGLRDEVRWDLQEGMETFLGRNYLGKPLLINYSDAGEKKRLQGGKKKSAPGWIGFRSGCAAAPFYLAGTPCMEKAVINLQL